MIEYLKIEGFKSFKKLELEMKPINILIGSNGSGKSNFLSFFQLARAIFNKRLQRYVQEEKADNILRFGRKYTEWISGKLIFSNGAHNNGYRFDLAQTKEGGLYISEEGSGYQVQPDSDSRNYFYNKNIAESQVASSPTYRDVFLKRYITALRTFHFHDTSSTSALRSVCDLDDNTELHSNGSNLPAFLYLLKEKHPKVFTRIEKAIQSVAPYIDRLILEPRQLSEGGQEIALRWADTGNPESSFSAYQLSDGTLRFIALATLFMQPAPPSVIIIDEPELGLHPFAIGKLASMIQAAANVTQIIAATQSPGLINYFCPEDILVLDRSSTEEQTLIKRLDSERLKTWLEEYSLGQLWEKDIVNAAQPFQK